MLPHLKNVPRFIPLYLHYVKNIFLHNCREVTIIHLDIPSIIVDKDSEEGRAQLEREQSKSNNKLSHFQMQKSTRYLSKSIIFSYRYGLSETSNCKGGAGRGCVRRS